MTISPKTRTFVARSTDLTLVPDALKPSKSFLVWPCPVKEIPAQSISDNAVQSHSVRTRRCHRGTRRRQSKRDVSYLSPRLLSAADATFSTEACQIRAVRLLMEFGGF